MKSIICIAIFAVIFCGVHAVEFTDCGSTTGSFKQVSVSDCDTSKPQCILKRNTNATITIDFESKTNSESVTAVCHGHIMGVDVPFPLPHSDGCSNSGIECPISTGSTYKFEATLPVLRAYPKVKVDVKWELKDAEGKDIICVLIPAKIE